MFSPAQWQLLAAEVVRRWPIQAQSSRSMVCVKRADWIAIQRHVFPDRPPVKTFNLDDVRQNLVKTLTAMIRQIKDARYERTFVVPEQPVMTRSEGRAHVKAWKLEQNALVTEERIKPRVLVVGVIADQERSLRESFPEVDLSFWKSNTGVNHGVDLNSYDLIIGMVSKMSHTQDSVLSKSSKYQRVTGAFSAIRRELTSWLPTFSSI